MVVAVTPFAVDPPLFPDHLPTQKGPYGDQENWRTPGPHLTPLTAIPSPAVATGACVGIPPPGLAEPEGRPAPGVPGVTPDPTTPPPELPPLVPELPPLVSALPPLLFVVFAETPAPPGWRPSGTTTTNSTRANTPNRTGT